MVKNRDFYTVYSYSDDLKEGKEATVKHSISFCDERADLAPLVCLSVGDLSARIAASKKKEKAIFDKLCSAMSEWEEQAAETMLTEKALEYLRTPAVQHTSNQWKKTEYGHLEISNMVYKMTYHISEDTRYDHKLKKSVPYRWCVTWRVLFNAPHKRDYYRNDISIAGQDKKAYGDKTSAERYMQGRIDAYAHLFTELSPPIPEDQRGRFSVNGCLLPGYTVEQHKPTVAELLDYLDDEDIPADGPQEKEESVSPFKKYAHKKPPIPGKGKPAPER